MLIAIGSQTRATIVLDPQVAALRSPGVRGHHSLRAALKQALRDTGAQPRFYDHDTVRVSLRRAPPQMPRRAPTQTSAHPPDEQGVPIIVTASKQNAPIDRYPGAVKLINLDFEQFAGGGNDVSAVMKRLPAMGSTNLGSGRNKFFIRGIADSSFSGPTQATTGQYFGDTRLNYNAPDPDLNLYDMKRVEVLVGPQGTLYGAGSLGGIIRLVPNAPDVHYSTASASAGIGTTQHGGTSLESAAMFNLPLVADRLAARLVVYGGYSAGYIDAPAQGRRDINGTTRSGLRFALHGDDVLGWNAELGLVSQRISSGDGQYTLSEDPPLTRDTPIRQPFHNNYELGYLTLARPLGQAQLTASASLSSQRLNSTFDATGLDGNTTPLRAKESNRIRMFSTEARLSSKDTENPWVAGISALSNWSKVAQSASMLRAPEVVGQVDNRRTEAAIFGQYSHPLSSELTGTIGARLTLAHNITSLRYMGIPVLRSSSRTNLSPSGTLGLNWHPGGPLSTFLQFQHGYRPGGLGVAFTTTALEKRQYTSDNLFLYELGVRLGDPNRDRLTVSASIFAARWHDIQADLIVDPGLPYTTNIGNGHVRGLDIYVTWKPAPGLSLSLSAFLNDSRLSRTAQDFDVAEKNQGNRLTRALPNIARNGGRASATWNTPLSPTAAITSNLSLRYVGLSHLGVGPFLNVEQGNYLVTDVAVSIDFGRWGISGRIDNVGGVLGNTFAYGNPYGLGRRDQVTPLRPRTLTLSVQSKF